MVIRLIQKLKKKTKQNKFVFMCVEVRLCEKRVEI